MPHNAQNLLPKICTKSQIIYKSACMADRPEMFGPTRGFSGMTDSMEPCKMSWADPCCLATKFGLGAEIQSPTSLFYLNSATIYGEIKMYSTFVLANLKMRREVDIAPRSDVRM